MKYRMWQKKYLNSKGTCSTDYIYITQIKTMCHQTTKPEISVGFSTDVWFVVIEQYLADIQLLKKSGIWAFKSKY